MKSGQPVCPIWAEEIGVLAQFGQTSHELKRPPILRTGYERYRTVGTPTALFGAVPQLSSKAVIGAFAGQRRPGFQMTIVNKINYSMLFPLLLLLGNICAAICYAFSGDWKKALYWAASSVCIASITF